MITAFSNEWFLDYESEHKVISHRIKEQVVSTKTQFQNVKILDTYYVGRVLVLDNKLQSLESDEYVYHECLVHPPVIDAQRRDKVLILGGGEGATLREVVRYKDVKEIIMVDIDEELVKLSEKYLPTWHKGAFRDKRVRLIFDDAVKFVEQTDEVFDVVIMDITDPLEEGPAALMYTQEFFHEPPVGTDPVHGISETEASSRHLCGTVGITDCVFYSNQVVNMGTGGGGLFLFSSQANITGTTFAYNKGHLGTCIKLYGGSSPTIENCILAFGRIGIPIHRFDENDAVTTSRCVVYGNEYSDDLVGTFFDILYEDPRFCGMPTGDLTLCSNSPALPDNNPWTVLMGAHGSGCGDCDSPVEDATWGRIKELYR